MSSVWWMFRTSTRRSRSAPDQGGRVRLGELRRGCGLQVERGDRAGLDPLDTGRTSESVPLVLNEPVSNQHDDSSVVEEANDTLDFSRRRRVSASGRLSCDKLIADMSDSHTDSDISLLRAEGNDGDADNLVADELAVRDPSTPEPTP